MARRCAKYITTTVDYFTRWVEPDALVKMSSTNVDFLARNVMCRYGIRLLIISNNGLQFNSEKFIDFCQQHGIRISFAHSVIPANQ